MAQRGPADAWSEPTVPVAGTGHGQCDGAVETINLPKSKGEHGAGVQIKAVGQCDRRYHTTYHRTRRALIRLAQTGTTLWGGAGKMLSSRLENELTCGWR